MMQSLCRVLSSAMARSIARSLTLCRPKAARSFYFWYRSQTIRHPNWVAPINWDRTVKLANGSRFRVPFAEVHGMSLILDRNYEPELTQRISEHLRPGDVFIDVGANMGYFTLHGARLVGEQGLVVAFEPAPTNLRWLTYNLVLNDLSNVLVLSTALADDPGVKRLTVPPLYNNGVSTLRAIVRSERTTPAWVQRFDELPVDVRQSGRVVLVKIDTEGLEIDVLRGMSLLLRDNPRLAVACELSPEWYDVAELVRMLVELGFRGEYFHEGRWLPLTLASLPKVQCNAWFQRY